MSNSMSISNITTEQNINISNTSTPDAAPNPVALQAISGLTNDVNPKKRPREEVSELQPRPSKLPFMKHIPQSELSSNLELAKMKARLGILKEIYNTGGRRSVQYEVQNRTNYLFDTDENGDSLLHYCASRGESVILSVLSSLGGNIYLRNKKNKTPKDFAEDFNRENVIRLYKRWEKEKRPSRALAVSIQHISTQLLKDNIKTGLNVNFQYKNGETLFHKAARINKLTKARLLMEAGANPFLVRKDGKTPLQVAPPGTLTAKALEEYESAYQNMQNTDNVNLKKRPRKEVSVSQRISKLPFMKHIPQSELSSNLKPSEMKRRLGILKTIENTQVRNSVQYEVQSRTNYPFDTDKNGNSLLHFCALSDESNILAVLGRFGANINLKNNNGKTPKDIAEDHDCTNVKKLYRKWEKEKRPSQTLATTIQHISIQLLKDNIKTGLNVNLQYKKGETLLHKAARANKLTKLQLLTGAGANPFLVREDGKTPLQVAPPGSSTAKALKEYERTYRNRQNNG